ncbi:TPA: hypothetical protein ACIYS6_005600, partial [Escherichia coli]
CTHDILNMYIMHSNIIVFYLITEKYLSIEQCFLVCIGKSWVELRIKTRDYWGRNFSNPKSWSTMKK